MTSRFNARPQVAPRRKVGSCIAAAIGLLALTLLAGCGQPAPAPAPPPPPVTVSTPVEREVTDWDVYTGRLQTPQPTTVVARVSGFLVETRFEEGAFIRKGEVLFVLDDRPFKADLDNKRAVVAKDEAEVELARTNMNRAAQLLKSRAIAQQEYDTRKAAYEQALAQQASDRALMKIAELNLEWTRVTAPIDGRIGRFEVTEGNFVNGGAGQATRLTTIVSVDPIYCYVPVPERKFLEYREYAAKKSGGGAGIIGLSCQVQLEDEASWPHHGVIDFFDNTLDPSTGTIQIRGVIPNPNGSLTPGLFARMRISGTGTYKTLLVPDSAIGTSQNERFVKVVGKDDIVSTKVVKVGGLFGKLRSIVEGLGPEDLVITKGSPAVRADMKVAPQEEPIPADMLAGLDAPEPRQASVQNAPKHPPTGAPP